MERVKRRWWTLSISAMAALVVLATVASGLFQLAVLALPGYRAQLADYVSRVAGRPIDIGGVALVWYRLRPQLELEDVVLYNDEGTEPALSAESLRIGFGLWRLLQGDSFPSRIELAGLQVVVEIDADDQVHVRGLDTAGPSSATHDWGRDVARFDSIRVEDSMITVDDARLVGGRPQFHLRQATARRRHGGASFEASVDLPQFMGHRADLELSVDGDPSQPATWQGSWTLDMSRLLRLPWLEARVPGHPRLQLGGADLKLSGAVDHGSVPGADLRLQSPSIQAQRGSRLAQLRDVAIAASAHHEAATWTVEVPQLQVTGDTGPWPATRLRLQWTSALAGGGELEADADYLRLQDLTPWLMLGPDPSTARLAGVSGELRGLVGRMRFGRGDPQYTLRAQLDGLGLAAAGDNPGFSGLKGEISATEAGGRLSVAPAPFELKAARVFASPVEFDRLEGALDWTHNAEGWRLNMPGFAWALRGTQGQGDLQLLLPTDPSASPVIKLGAQFMADDVTRLKPYMPLHWTQSLHDWLDRAIVAGRVPHGRIDIEGELARFPFKEGDGRFELDIDVADARLAYAPDWPAAEQVAARLQFRAGALAITGESGRLSGNRIEHLAANIPDFKGAVLSIDGEVDGEAARYYDFLRASPLARRLSGLLNRTQASGTASVAIKLSIPLADVQHTQVDGSVKLKGVDLLYQGLEEPFRHLEGDIAFTGEGASARQISGSFYGVPALASLAPVGGGNLRLVADLDASLQADGAGLSRFIPAILRPHLSGGSHFRADLLLGPQSDGVTVSSDLRGVAVDLPDPIGKTAAQPQPLSVRIGAAVAPAVPGADPATAPFHIGVRYGDRLGVDVQLGHGAAAMPVQRVLLRAGSGEIPLATEDGLRITGTVAELDLGAWIDTVSHAVSAPAAATADAAGGSGPELRLQSIDLHAALLHYLGYSAAGLQLGYRPRANGAWSATLAGDDAEGTVDWDLRPGAALVARFKKLRLKPRPHEAADTDAARPASEPLDPNHLPTLDLDADALSLGEAQLGHVRLLSERIDGGQRLSQLSAGGAEADLKGHGEWLRRGGSSSGNFSFDLDSSAIGPLLEGFGYARNVSAARSRFHGDLSWPASPAGLEWSQVRGGIDLDLERGTLSAVEPGAGRVLGLLNFYALPRRLLLDFRDVVSKGLGFDHVKGHFDAGNGDARTNDLGIESPSLKIDVRGRIGLAARDYDEHIRVYPDVAGGVTLGALLLGGPAAGAIALLAQQVLDKPLESITQLSYRVTGSWDNPQVLRAE